MTKHGPTTMRRTGAYIVKAAESRPTPVVAASIGRPTPAPSTADRRLAAALLETRRS
jgi:hypothetical protein